MLASLDPIESPAPGALHSLLHPLPIETFRSDHFDRTVLHLPGGAGKFAALASARQLRALVLSGTPWHLRRVPEVYLDGSRVDPRELVREYIDMDGNEARAPIIPRILRLLEAGATISCFGVESHFPPLAALRRALAVQLAAEVETPLFYSQQRHQGLSPHYDCVDVFVLQISGSKRWFVSELRASNPVCGLGMPTPYDPEVPLRTIDLQAGHLLYLPRGTFHYARALSKESLHASVVVRFPTYVDMVESLLGTAGTVDALRAYLPVAGDSLREVDMDRAKETLLGQLASAVHSPQFDASLREALAARTAQAAVAAERSA